MITTYRCGECPTLVSTREVRGDINCPICGGLIIGEIEVAKEIVKKRNKKTRPAGKRTGKSKRKVRKVRKP